MGVLKDKRDSLGFLVDNDLRKILTRTLEVREMEKKAREWANEGQPTVSVCHPTLFHHGLTSYAEGDQNCKRKKGT
jgi:hypothetical protein